MDESQVAANHRSLSPTIGNPNSVLFPDKCTTVRGAAVPWSMRRSYRWYCAQIGAREHYALPRVLHRDGRLMALYTDYWAGPVLRAAARRSKAKALHSLGARFHRELADAAVISWNARSLVWEFGLRKSSDRFFSFMKIGSQFASRVCQALKSRSDLGPNSVFFSYDTGALEAMEWCRERGIKCILGQMDPSRVEVDLVRDEEKRWPGWSVQPLEVPEAYFCRREKEWALADRVIVNSNFCREALVKQGVASGKISVVPLSYEPEQKGRSSERAELKQTRDQPVRVLFLGQVILRKGIQYLMQAAKLLEKENLHFDVVGPIGISPDAMASAPKNMTFHDRATRDETTRWYQASDIFVLPTLSDGFAITQLEAMSHGLPVITTPCCGAVVDDGKDGFIVPARNVDALANAFRRYLVEPQLLQDQSNAALEKSKQFNLDRLAANICSLEQSLFS